MKNSNIVISLAILAVLSTALYAVEKPEYYQDRVLVRVSENAGPIVPALGENGWVFGIDEIDNSIGAVEFSAITKLFTRLEKPSNPRQIDLTRVFVMHFPPEADVKRVIDLLESSPYIEYAEPYYLRRTAFTPNDPNFNNQYGLNNSHTQAELAWDYMQGDPSVIVCICDTGIDMDHPDLMDSRWFNPGEDLNGNGVFDPGENNGIDDDANSFIDDFYGWDFPGNDNNPDDNAAMGGHGTHCSGIASATSDNGTGIASLGFSTSIMTARCGTALFITHGFEAIEYGIDNNADVISLSWGGGGYSQTEQDVFNYANSLGILVVAAAGNNGSSNMFYPSAYQNVMSVAATSQGDSKAGFSNYGSWIDISAPGDDIYSTYPGGGYTNMSGTSMACPFTAGLGVLVKSAYPQFNADEIELIIKLTADNIDAQNPSYVGQLGWGRINAYNAMSMLMYDVSAELVPESTPIQIPGSGGDFTFDQTIANTSNMDYTVNIHTVAVLPSGVYYRINSDLGVNLPAGGVIEELGLSQTIPAGAPLGFYTYLIVVMENSDRNLLSMASFTFEKTGAFDSSNDLGDWQLLESADSDLSANTVVPDNYSLSAPYPNPFNPETTLNYHLPNAGQISLNIYDIQGRNVRTLVDGWNGAGYHQAVFTANELSSGIYFAVFRAGNYSETRKLTLLK